MNQNIKVITPKLWVVNFHYVKMGFIQELEFKVTNEEDTMCLMDDGKWILNSAIPLFEQRISYIKAVMQLPTERLHTEKGFATVVKTICPGLKKASAMQIEAIIQQHNLEALKSIFQSMCEVETKRRQLQSNYKKNGRKSLDLRPLFSNLTGKAGDG